MGGDIEVGIPPIRGIYRIEDIERCSQPMQKLVSDIYLGVGLEILYG